MEPHTDAVVEAGAKPMRRLTTELHWEPQHQAVDALKSTMCLRSSAHTRQHGRINPKKQIGKKQAWPQTSKEQGKQRPFAVAMRSFECLVINETGNVGTM